MSNLKSLSSGVHVPSASSPTNFDDYVVPPVIVPGEGTIWHDNFESYDTEITGWGDIGYRISLAQSGGANGGKYMKVNYEGPGTSPYICYKNVSSANASEMWVQFDFKQTGARAGSKCLKLFNIWIDGAGNQANSTWGCEYETNVWERIGYGDGTTRTNDTQSEIFYRGFSWDPLVQFVVDSGPVYPADGNWHRFKMYMKYNTDDNRDGEYKTYYDNVLICHAVNVRNRHNLNTRIFNLVSLANYTSSELSFEQGYDNFSCGHTEADLLY